MMPAAMPAIWARIVATIRRMGVSVMIGMEVKIEEYRWTDVPRIVVDGGIVLIRRHIDCAPRIDVGIGSLWRGVIGAA
jgi:hypothetical protein